MHFKVKQIETGQIHLVWKLLDTLEGQHIWSVTWEGHHIIGQDCEWYSAPPTTEQSELWKEVEYIKDFYKSKISNAIGMGAMGLAENLKEQLDNAIQEKYSITRKSLTCSLDEQQCRDSCDHKEDRSQCPFVTRKEEVSEDEKGDFAVWCVENYFPMFDEKRKFKFLIKGTGMNEQIISLSEAYKEFQLFKKQKP